MAVHLKIDGDEVAPAKITGDMFLALLEMQQLDELKFAELIDGVLVDMTPANNRHGLAQGEMLFAIRSALPDTFTAFIDPILRLGPHSLVGPDIAVLRKGVIPEESAGSEFLLCVEISDTSLSTDLRRKAELCGINGVREYWVVDLNGRKLHVHRNAGPAGYRSVVAQAWEVAASPLFAPEMMLDLSSILKDLD